MRRLFLGKLVQCHDPMKGAELTQIPALCSNDRRSDYPGPSKSSFYAFLPCRMIFKDIMLVSERGPKQRHNSPFSLEALSPNSFCDKEVTLPLWGSVSLFLQQRSKTR